MASYLLLQVHHYHHTHSGDYTYRIDQPGAALSEHPQFEVINLHIAHPDFARLSLEADVLVAHMITAPEFQAVIRERRRLGLPTVYEIPDNLLDLGVWIEETSAYRAPRNRANLFTYAGECDALQFSTEELTSIFGACNRNHVVFPNYVARFSEPKPIGKPLIIGWGGSRGHAGDLAAAAPTIARFCAEHEDVVFSFMGAKHVFDDYFGGMSADQLRYTPPGSMSDYQDWLETLDIGLAPLLDTAFNRCRSDSKFLEYGSFGIAPVLADAPPYRATAEDGRTALFFDSHQGLYRKLSLLYNDRNLLEELGEAAYRYVVNERTEAVDMVRRASYYGSLLQHKPTWQSKPLLRNSRGAEDRINRALNLLEGDDALTALGAACELISVLPDYMPAHLIAARARLQLGYDREVAQDYRPHCRNPIYGDLFAEQIIAAARKFDDATAEEVIEGVQDPATKLKLTADDEIEPETRWRKILELNPNDYQAMVELGGILANRPEHFQEAQALMRRIFAMHPESEGYLKEAGYAVEA
ncbi:MAG: glycosyltransferase [Acidobacteriota bacterium]|nr:glycosyltransferase [Acidobacteriota bacterium]